MGAIGVLERPGENPDKAAEAFFQTRNWRKFLCQCNPNPLKIAICDRFLDFGFKSRILGNSGINVEPGRSNWLQKDQISWKEDKERSPLTPKTVGCCLGDPKTGKYSQAYRSQFPSDGTMIVVTFPQPEVVQIGTALSTVSGQGNKTTVHSPIIGVCLFPFLLRKPYPSRPTRPLKGTAWLSSLAAKSPRHDTRLRGARSRR
jgi:hypothetical protein